MKNIQNCQIFCLSRTGSSSSRYGYCRRHKQAKLSREKHNRSESGSTVKVSRWTQKVEIHDAKKRSPLRKFSTDLRYIFGSNFDDLFGVILTENGPHNIKTAYEIVRLHPLMIYTDVIEYKIAGDANDPLFRCFPPKSKPKLGEFVTIGQCMKCGRFKNLQFWPLPKKKFSKGSG